MTEHSFAQAREARLTPNDFAKMLKVSRVTASCWFNNRSKPHRLICTRVGRVLAAVNAAMGAGDFPVPYEVPKRERYLYVSKTISKHLANEPRSDDVLAP
jgi:DNA-binding XRE family transcriptional regulator